MKCCSKENFPALEHDNGCPQRISFYGAPSEWGLGMRGQVRQHGEKYFIWEMGIQTWKPIAWISENKKYD